MRARRAPAGRALAGGTDLPVLLPVAERHWRRAAEERAIGAPMLRLRAWHGAAIALVIVCWTSMVWAQDAASGAEAKASALMAIWRWLPVLLGGFMFNIAISFLAMGIGTATGTMLGIMQISELRPMRGGSWLITQFFRNAPWLVLLFYCMFLLPFEFSVFGFTVPLPDWVKAVIGLALPVMANVSEIVRGAIQSIPSGQWEAAESLAFNRRQVLFQIILPQCIKRMLPPWMNLYAILTMATVLASVVGVSEVMTLTQRALAAESRPELLVPFYGFAMLLFFAYCYPIARATHKLELRYAVKI